MRRAALAVVLAALLVEAVAAQDVAVADWEAARRIYAEDDALVPTLRERAARRPDDPWSAYFLAMAARQAGLLDEAGRAAARALSLRPDEALIHAELAELARARRRWEDAARHGARAADLAARDDERAYYAARAADAADRARLQSAFSAAGIGASAAAAAALSLALLLFGRRPHTSPRVP